MSGTEINPKTPLRQHQLDDLGMMPILKLLVSLKFCLHEIQDTTVPLSPHSFTPPIHSAVGFDITLTPAQIGDNKSTEPPLNLQNIHGYQLLDNQTFDEGDRQLPSLADPNPQ